MDWVNPFIHGSIPGSNILTCLLNGLIPSLGSFDPNWPWSDPDLTEPIAISTHNSNVNCILWFGSLELIESHFTHEKAKSARTTSSLFIESHLMEIEYLIKWKEGKEGTALDRILDQVVGTYGIGSKAWHHVTRCLAHARHVLGLCCMLQLPDHVTQCLVHPWTMLHDPTLPANVTLLRSWLVLHGPGSLDHVTWSRFTRPSYMMLSTCYVYPWLMLHEPSMSNMPAKVFRLPGPCQTLGKQILEEMS